jgi:DNA-binding CsgD family transcriptional regulator
MNEKLTMDKIQQILLLTEKGLFRSQIAKKLGISEMTVYNYQRKLDLI